MIAEFDARTSIGWQVQRLRERYADLLNQAHEAKGDDRRYFRFLFEICATTRETLGTEKSVIPEWPLSVCLFLEQEYRLTWLMHYVTTEDWSHKVECEETGKYSVWYTPRYLRPESWGLEAFWESIAKTKFAAQWFIPGNEEYNNQRFQLAPATGGAPYDLSPEKRHITMNGTIVGECKNYYMDIESRSSAMSTLDVAMAQHRHEVAAECLFRLKHMFFPGWRPEKLERSLPEFYGEVQMYESWLLGRLEQDPGRRTAFGWLAVYWLLFGMAHSPRGWNPEEPLTKLCALIVEFGLWPPEETREMLRYFKILAARNDIGNAERMAKDPTPILRHEELNILDLKECTAIYREVTTEHGRGKSSPRKPAKSSRKRKSKASA